MADDHDDARTECRGFHWIGQPWTSCDNCGRPWWEHEGIHHPSAPFDIHDPGTITLWPPETKAKAEAIRETLAGRHG